MAAALDQARAAEVDAQAARLMLASNIARAYIGLAQATTPRSRRSRSRARQPLADLSRQRVQAGLDNQLQLRNAEATIAAATQQAQAARSNRPRRNALAALLGKGPDRGLAIATPACCSARARRARRAAERTARPSSRRRRRALARRSRGRTHPLPRRPTSIRR
jgi:outer membrane protein TolC